jgi:hypothetical protein
MGHRRRILASIHECMRIDEYERKKKHFEIQASLNKLPLNSSIFAAANQEILKNANNKNLAVTTANCGSELEKFNNINNINRSKCISCRSSSVTSHSSSASSSYLPSQQSSSNGGGVYSSLNCTELNCKNYIAKRRDSSLNQVKSSFKLNYEKLQTPGAVSVNTTALAPLQSNSQVLNPLNPLNQSQFKNQSINKLRTMTTVNSSVVHGCLLDSPVLYAPSIGTGVALSDLTQTNCSDTSIEEGNKGDQRSQADDKRCPKPIWNNDPLHLINSSSNFIVYVSFFFHYFGLLATQFKGDIQLIVFGILF